MSCTMYKPPGNLERPSLLPLYIFLPSIVYTSTMVSPASRLSHGTSSSPVLVPPIKELFADAHLHPNDEGFSHYAENLIKEMQKYL